jgi:hypothetical protein
MCGAEDLFATNSINKEKNSLNYPLFIALGNLNRMLKIADQMKEKLR